MRQDVVHLTCDVSAFGIGGEPGASLTLAAQFGRAFLELVDPPAPVAQRESAEPRRQQSCSYTNTADGAFVVPTRPEKASPKPESRTGAVRMAGTGIGVGDTLDAVRAAYPQYVFHTGVLHQR